MAATATTGKLIRSTISPFTPGAARPGGVSAENPSPGLAWRCFISEPGGPGEPQLSKGQPLKYSERLKTITSFTKDQPLPNKVMLHVFA